MKKVLKYLIFALIGLAIIGTFVYLFKRSQPKEATYETLTPTVMDIRKTTIVTGKIQHYYGEGDKGEYHNYEIANGALVHAEVDGVENIALGVEAQKVMMEGVVYIVRDNKLFNLQGVQIR